MLHASVRILQILLVHSLLTYLLTYLLNPWPWSTSELCRPRDRRLSAKLVPTSADRGCRVVSVTDPYGHILGFLDRTCCVNPIDNTHYAPVTTTPTTRTEWNTRTLAQVCCVRKLNIHPCCFRPSNGLSIHQIISPFIGLTTHHIIFIPLS
jgi:hypothetical protein